MSRDVREAGMCLPFMAGREAECLANKKGALLSISRVKEAPVFRANVAGMDALQALLIFDHKLTFYSRFYL